MEEKPWRGPLGIRRVKNEAWSEIKANVQIPIKNYLENY